jgi:hypothetical protein
MRRREGLGVCRPGPCREDMQECLEGASASAQRSKRLPVSALALIVSQYWLIE